MEPIAPVTQTEGEVLAITMLGSFRVRLGSQDLHPEQWELQKAVGVFKFLVCEEGRWVPDDVLLDLFWPTSDLERGRKALRTTLYHLRRYLEPELRPYERSTFIAARRRAYRFRIEAPHLWDVRAFLTLSDEAVKAAETKAPEELCPLLRQALAVATGDFLPEDRYEEWTTLWREQLRMRYLEMVALLSTCARQVDPGAIDVVHHLKKATTAHPEREDLTRELMWHLAASGNVLAALKHYETCSSRIREEFGEELSEPTRALALQLRQGAAAPGGEACGTGSQAEAGAGSRTADDFGTGRRSGSLMLGWPSFRRLVEWERARLRRSGGQGSLVLLSADPLQRAPCSWEELVEEVETARRLSGAREVPFDDPAGLSPAGWQVAISKELRSSDALCPLDTQRLLVLLPEKDAASAHQAVARVLAAAEKRVPAVDEGSEPGDGSSQPAVRYILPLTGRPAVGFEKRSGAAP